MCDYIIYHKVWLVQCNKSDEGRYCREFSIAYVLTQIIEEPFRVPEATGHQANLLDLFLASCPDKCLAKFLPPLVISDYSLIRVQIGAEPKTSLSF